MQLVGALLGKIRREKWQVNQAYAYFQHIKNLSLLIPDLPIVGGGIAVMCGGTQNLMSNALLF